MSVAAWQPYDDASEAYFDSYERLSFSIVHRSLLPFLPGKGSTCLDVGAGSGRDAAALARRGYAVTAVEPSLGLRVLAQRRHGSGNIRWIDDNLPRLSKLRKTHEQYNFILLSAVWMHIPPEDRHESLATLAGLLAEGGRIAITLRLGKAEDARTLHRVDATELTELAAKFGLISIYTSRLGSDSLRRHDVTWQKVVLEKA